MTFRKQILFKYYQGEVFCRGQVHHMRIWHVELHWDRNLNCHALSRRFALNTPWTCTESWWPPQLERTGDTWGLHFWEIGRSCSMKLCGDNFGISSQRISHQSFWQRLFLVERFQVKSIASMQRHHPHARTTILQENRRTNRISLTYCG